METDCLFDEDEETAGCVPTNYLVVGPVCATSEELNVIEQAFRMRARPPVIFEDDGQLEDAEKIARKMGLPAGQVPTLEEAEAFVIALHRNPPAALTRSAETQPGPAVRNSGENDAE
jgi:hypothetical protein